MGSWGPGIKENDTSFDVYESFFELYNLGETLPDIKRKIIEQFKYSLEDFEDTYNVVFPLALCLWEAGELDNELYQQVKKAIETDADIQVWTALGGNDKDIAKRKETLRKLLLKISTPNPKPKKRKKPPVLIETIYKSGSAVSFQYPDGSFGGAIIINSECFQNKGFLDFTITDIRMKTAPTFTDFENAKIPRFEWDWVSNEAIGYSAKIGEDGRHYAGRLYVTEYLYSIKKEKEEFFKICDRLFTVVGAFPEFTQILLGTTWATGDKLISRFDFTYNKYEAKTNETIKNLATILYNPKNK